MEEIQLEVQVRNDLGKREVKKVRREDFIPAIIYGGKGKSHAIKVDRRTYGRIRRLHHGENIILYLSVLEGDQKKEDDTVIVKEEQHDPVSDKVLHIDFKRISLKEKLEVRVPLVPKGEPLGVKRDGGSLEHVLWEIDVVCLPTMIPEEITTDVSAMEIGDVVHVKDLQLPEGVVTKHDPDSIVYSVVPPMKEEVTEKPEGAEGEPELVKEKKEGAAEEEGTPEEPKKDIKKEAPKEEKGK